MATETKEKTITHMLPEGRVINNSLQKKDIYKDPKTGKEGKPRYTLEMAFDPKAVEGEGTIEDQIIATIENEWGRAAGDDYMDFLEGKPTRFRWANPFLDGDRLAREREERKKEGDAYKGKLVLRCSTEFNREGANAPGGVAVFGPNVEPISEVLGNASEVYNGCYGKVGITLRAYEINGNRYVSTYLQAFQKTRDGDKLSTSGDKSTLFQPVAGAAPEGGRRRRAG